MNDTAYGTRPLDVCDTRNLGSIVRSLSRLPRFAGNSDRFISVAQHSVLVSYLTEGDERVKRIGLLHDITECITGDIPTPVKKAVPELERIEGEVWESMRKEFDLPEILPKAVIAADKLSVFLEGVIFGVPHIARWEGYDQVDFGLGMKTLMAVPGWTESWDHVDAYSRFIARHQELLSW